jgi:P27 family predicted phage terminase small subunit
MRGRKPKPVQRQIAEGDPRMRGVHKLDEKLASLPKAARGLPEVPSHLGRVAAMQWVMWKNDLELMGMDFHADAVVLEGACVNYERALEADEILKREGLLVEDSVIDKVSGQVIGTRIKAHPSIGISSNCWRNVQSFCSDLGLSLVSRQRLAIDAPNDGQDELNAILSQPFVRKPIPPVN